MQHQETLSLSVDPAAIDNVGQILQAMERTSPLGPLTHIRKHPGQRIMKLSCKILQHATFPATREAASDSIDQLGHMAWLLWICILPKPLIVDIFMMPTCTIVGGIFGVVGVTTTLADNIANAGCSLVPQTIVFSFLVGLPQTMEMLCAIGSEDPVSIRRECEVGNDTDYLAIHLTMTAWRSRGAQRGTLNLASGHTLSERDCPAEWGRVFRLVEQLKSLFESVMPINTSRQDTYEFLARWGPPFWAAFKADGRLEFGLPELAIIVAQVQDIKQALSLLRILKERHEDIVAAIGRVRMRIPSRNPPPYCLEL